MKEKLDEIKDFLKTLDTVAYEFDSDETYGKKVMAGYIKNKITEIMERL